MPVQSTQQNEYIKDLKNSLAAASSDAELFDTIVNAPFKNKLQAIKIDLGIMVFLQVNKNKKTIDRIALSDTDLAKRTLRVSAKPFREIKIPLDHPTNSIAQAIATNTIQNVTDWKYLFVPALKPEAARLNQANAGIEYSVIFPLASRNRGALIFSFFQPPDTLPPAHRNFIEEYGTLVDKSLT